MVNGRGRLRGPQAAAPLGEALVDDGVNSKRADRRSTRSLKESGVAVSNPKLMRALNWLRSHQDKGGYWAAESMNRKYDAGSMPALFMRDAATAFAVLALLDANGSNRSGE